MLFSNKKEEVIDLKLTMHGRRLLSQGLLKPVYYSFHDDNILYDAARVSGSSTDVYEGLAGSVEIQSNIQKRISEETPYLKTQHNFSGREVRPEDPRQLAEREQSYVLGPTLGTVDIGAFKSPAWEVAFLHNSSSAQTTAFENASKHQLVNIPQVETEIMYETAVGYTTAPRDLPRAFEDDPELAGSAHMDATYVAVDPDYILLNVEEKNSVYMPDNYDIEVYESGSNGWNKLDFAKRQETIVDGFIVNPRKQKAITPDPSYVEYFFDVLVDEEIPENLICRGVQKLKVSNILIDTDVECPDLDGTFDINPYISDTPDLDCP
jgi:hypothetical protein